VAGLIVIGFIQSKKLVGLVVLGIVAAPLLIPGIGARFADLSETTQANGTPSNSLSWRMEYWQEAIALAKDSPVVGIGLKMVASDTEEGKQPHNDFVRVYVETGVLGLIAYIALIVTFFLTARKALRVTQRRIGELDRGLAVGSAAVALVFLTSGLVANVISQVVLLWYVFAFAGIAVAITRDAEAGAVPAVEPAPEPAPEPAREPAPEPVDEQVPSTRLAAEGPVSAHPARQ
jgi:O-antigen ligase